MKNEGGTLCVKGKGKKQESKEQDARSVGNKDAKGKKAGKETIGVVGEN